MDFLGLTSLTILDQAVKLVRRSQGVEIDLQTLPLDDGKTFELLSSGNTTDVFQLESAGMQRYIEKLKPSNIGDIAAMIALYRPGPMENIDRFIDSKHGRTAVTYPHPSLKELLDETYGIIVYQDQVLLILQQFAGYSLGRSRHRAQGDGQENRLADGRGTRQLCGRRNRQGLRPGSGSADFRSHRTLRRLRLQQGPQRQLCPHFLLDGLLQGPLPGGIHGGGAERPAGQHRQDHQLHQRMLPAGHSHLAARR